MVLHFSLFDDLGFKVWAFLSIDPTLICNSMALSLKFQILVPTPVTCVWSRHPLKHFTSERKLMFRILSVDSQTWELSISSYQSSEFGDDSKKDNTTKTITFGILSIVRWFWPLSAGAEEKLSSIVRSRYQETASVRAESLYGDPYWALLQKINIFS